MRQLYPTAREGVPPQDVYLDQRRRPHSERPWVLLNMVASADGATVINGVSERLGGTADREVFLYLRTVADAILAGAGTVRAEAYGPPRVRPEHRAAREQRGQQPVPLLCVATRSVGFDWTERLFSDGHRPVLLAPADADAARLDEAHQHCEVITAGTGQLDLADALRQLRSRGVEILLCEGGPSLNGTLLERDLVDEVCLTIAPTLVGRGGGATIVGHAALAAPIDMELVSLVEQDGELLARYLLRRSPATAAG